MTNMDKIFIALADPTRRQVVMLLRQRPRSAGELALALKMSAPAMSRHLRVLRHTGLVQETGVLRDARLRIYRLRREPFTRLMGWLKEIEAFWTEELDAFKVYTEKRSKGGRQ
jgi:DNA-binding transcriptional ArsR family regulator